MQLSELLARWDANEGKPYKGSLIDWNSFLGGGGDDGTVDLGCMCAQGQVLHVVGGWEPQRLKNVTQVEADQETARLLNISTAHAILLRNVNDKVDGAPSIVLTDPGKVLGDQWSKLLDFWWHMDRMTPEQWAAARDAARDAAWEIQGARILRENGKRFYFLPMFGFADPEAIPARPENYGQA